LISRLCDPHPVIFDIAPPQQKRVGDTIEAEVAVTAVRPTRQGGRGVVASAITVTNQRGEIVMEYSAVRLVAGAV
jgi:acyl dehydratase